MRLLKDKIIKEGKIINNDIIKVDSFLNYLIDTKLLKEISKFLASHFKNVDKVLTIESSGIAFAVGVAMELGDIPVVFAKKNSSSVNSMDECYTAVVHSFTHNIDNHIVVNKNYIKPRENILIIDDFLAAGNAGVGLINICKQAHANVVGFADAIEKEYQQGRKKIEALGVKVCSAARIIGFKNNQPIFSNEEC